MRGSFGIGRVGRVQIRVHFSFLLVLPFLALLFGRVFREAAQLADVPAEQLVGTPLLWGLGVALALFLAVLIHELAHALYAVKKGGKVQDITLLMIGGVTHLTEPPRHVKHELVMALVGPLTSLALGGVFLAAFALLSESPSFNLRFALFYLGQLNLVLGVFNLLPAFPMDGGRVVRAALALKMGMVRGTQIAAGMGKVFAALFAIVGLLSFNLILLLIAYFVYLGADAEARQVLMKAVLGKLTVRELMTATAAPVRASDPLSEVAARMIRDRRLSLPVVEDEHLFGVITLRDLNGISAERRELIPAREVTHRVDPVAPGEDVWRGLQVMERAGLPQLPVVEDGRLVGALRREDVIRGLQLQELAASQRQPGWPMRRRREA